MWNFKFQSAASAVIADASAASADALVTPNDAPASNPKSDQIKFPSDKTHFRKRRFTMTELDMLTSAGACQPKETDMPNCKFPITTVENKEGTRLN